MGNVIVGPWPGSRLAHAKTLDRLSELAGQLAPGTGNPHINAEFFRTYPGATFSPLRNRVEWFLVHTQFRGYHLPGGITEIFDLSGNQVGVLTYEDLSPSPGEVERRFKSWLRTNKRPG